jgi:hypothetical protein
MAAEEKAAEEKRAREAAEEVCASAMSLTARWRNAAVCFYVVLCVCADVPMSAAMSGCM